MVELAVAEEFSSPGAPMKPAPSDRHHPGGAGLAVSAGDGAVKLLDRLLGRYLIAEAGGTLRSEAVSWAFRDSC